MVCEKGDEKVLRAGGCKDRIANMRRHNSIIRAFLPAVLCCMAIGAQGPNEVSAEKPGAKAAVIVCKGMIDDGLYKSIQRRTELALDGGANYLIYQIETYGGFVESGDNIAKYFIFEAADDAHTVAYVTSEAISAGAMIAVSCQDIIMLENTTIGDCAPIELGGKLEGIEREKVESFIRAAFSRAAEANNYPKPLLKAMVTMQTEVYRVTNFETGEYEFYEADYLPKDPNKYDLENKQLIVKNDELLTLTASEAEEYGIARAKVEGLDGVLEFLARRDDVEFVGQPMLLETSWSEEMVRWLNSPAVMGILLTVALLGVYVELNTPGIGLAGLIAAICFIVIVGSKYLVDMANWVEVALFVAGILLLFVEVLLIPGFGIAGLTGIVCILTGLFGMLVKNPPDTIPWPEGPESWYFFVHGIWAVALGFTGFVVLACIATKYLPKLSFLSGLVLSPTAAKEGTEVEVSMTAPPEGEGLSVRCGQVGEVTNKLRPAGKARFGRAVVDVVAEGDFLDSGTAVEIIEIRGNRVIVKKAND